jgi:hypothetical protein
MTVFRIITPCGLVVRYIPSDQGLLVANFEISALFIADASYTAAQLYSTVHSASPLPSLLPFRAGVGNLFINAGRTGYSHLCRGPQKKLMSWTVSETISLTQKVQLVFTWKRIINEQNWTYLLQQRGPHKKPWQAGCGPQAIVWAALLQSHRTSTLRRNGQSLVRRETFRRNILPPSSGLRQFVLPKRWHPPSSPHGVRTRRPISIKVMLSLVLN